MSAKVDYIRVLNDLKMQVNIQGKIDWVLSSGGKNVNTQRAKIHQMVNEESRNHVVDRTAAPNKLNFKISKNHMRMNSNPKAIDNYTTT
jgi:hypothetical protein